MNPDHPVLNLPDAPAWGLFIGQFGKFSVYGTLIACTIAFLLAVIFPTKFSLIRRNAFYLGCVGFILVFLSLATLFVKDQFQFQYVFNHSAHENPFSYKVASVWTAQQGSFLLWALYSAILGWLTLAKSNGYERWYTAAYALFLAVLAGILAYDTPFKLLDDVVQNGHTLLPPDGSGMVPGLQNYWVTIHPPIIFLGFGCLTVPFAYGIAAMLSGNATDWVKLCRAPVLFGVSVLGLGISLGGLWAYETQGWGGFWGWDPVENVSLVPWLFLVALAHGIIVQTAKKSWVSGNLFLSGLPFVSFVYGTFLTRSGLLDKVSVHSFAEMNGGARIILRFFLYAVVLGFAGLYIWRGHKLGRESRKTEPIGEGLNRASFYQLGTLSLCLMAFVISLGFSWPVITVFMRPNAQGAAVEGGVYHQTIFWFFAAVMIAMAIGPFVSWRREGLKSILSRFVTMASLAMGIVGVFLMLCKASVGGIQLEPGATVNGFWKNSTIPLAWAIAVLLFFCAFVAITNLWRAIELGRRSKLGIGPFISHFGIAVLLGGLIISKALEQRGTTVVNRDTPGTALGYQIVFKSLDPEKLQDRDNVVKFDVTDPAGKKHEIDPNMYFTGPNTAQTWPYIERTPSHDLYFFMHKPEVEFWSSPMTIKPGETLTNETISVKYLEMTREGEPGQMGTKFGAKLRVTSKGRSYDIHPTLTMTTEGLQPSLEPLANLRAGLMPQMDAATKAVTLQLYYDSPQFPFEVFYKPLTCLVWVGTGIFTLGGLLSAFYRSLAKKSPEGDFVAETAKIIDKDGNAPLATA